MNDQTLEPADGGMNRVLSEQAGTPENNAQFPVPPEVSWITVLDAQEHFRALGLPRSVEAIRKYCRQGKVEAEVIAGPKGDQHMIKMGSIDTFVAEQLKVLEAASRNVPVRDGTFRKIPVHSVTSRVEPEHPGTQQDANLTEKLAAQEKEIERLKRENRDLEIDKEVRARMNDVLEKNNDRLIGQLRETSQDAQEWSRKFGQLEERVEHLTLPAPVTSSEPSATVHPEDFNVPSGAPQPETGRRTSFSF